MTTSTSIHGIAAALLLALAALPFAAKAGDAEDLKATPYFKSCDNADFAEPQCLCFAKQLSHGGRNLDPALLTAMEEDFTLAGKGQITVAGVHAALSHRTPPLSASDSDINTAMVLLAKATNSCAHAQ